MYRLIFFRIPQAAEILFFCACVSMCVRKQASAKKSASICCALFIQTVLCSCDEGPRLTLKEEEAKLQGADSRPQGGREPCAIR